jgi:hypothetical protein
VPALVLLLIVKNLSVRIAVIPRLSYQFSWETVLIVGIQDSTVTETRDFTEDVGLGSGDGKLK